MTLIQFAIARSARQMADRVIVGDVYENNDRASAVFLFDQLAIYAAALTESEFAAMAPIMPPIWAAAKHIDRWRRELREEE